RTIPLNTLSITFRTPTSSSKAVVRFSTDTSSTWRPAKSGLILDIVIETGNPADAERFVSMLDRHIARTGAPPRQTAADGGYASRANLAAAKARGVADVALIPSRGAS